MTQSASTKPYSDQGEKSSSVSRLPADFQFFVASKADSAHLRISGSIETQDELDTVIKALQIMRPWFCPGDAQDAPPSPSTPDSGAQGEASHA